MLILTSYVVKEETNLTFYGILKIMNFKRISEGFEADFYNDEYCVSVSCLSFINNSSYAVRPSSSLGFLLKTGTSSLTHILETRICVLDESYHYANEAEKCAIIPGC